MRPALLLISLGLWGCDPEPPPPVLDCPVEGEAPAPTLLEVYAQLQSPICGNCHFPGSQAPDQSSPEALAALIDADSALYPPLKIIAPGDLRRSLMYLKVMGGTDAGYTGPLGEDTGVLMPRGGPALAEEKKALLRRWICAGAPAG
ncbi:MAG: hypothetical protein M3Y59_16215 [Myxococcota bacterium]|nr:hypothetical protein [Myxococcota bacterium]